MKVFFPVLLFLLFGSSLLYGKKLPFLVSAKIVQNYQNQKFTKIIATYSQLKFTRLSALDRIIYAHALNYKGATKRAAHLLLKTKPNNSDPAKFYLEYQKVKYLFLAEKQPLALAKIQLLLQKRLASNYTRLIFQLLGKHVNWKKDQKKLKQFFRWLFIRYPQNKSNPHFVKGYFAHLKKDNPKKSLQLIKQLWLKQDFYQFPKILPKKTALFFKKMNKSASTYEMLIHLRAQIRHRNNSYVNTTTLSYIKANPALPIRRKVSKVYFDNLLRWRKYTRIIRLLEKKKLHKGLILSSNQRKDYLFRLYLLKKRYSKAKAILNQYQKFSKTRNRFHFLFANHFYLRKKYSNSLFWLRKVRKKELSRSNRDKLLWAQFWSAIQVKNFSFAKKVFFKSQKHSFYNTVIEAQFCYWGLKYRWYSANQLKKTKNNPCFPKFMNHYYGLEARKLSGRYRKVRKFFRTPFSQVSLKLKGNWSDFFYLLYQVEDKELVDHFLEQALKQNSKQFNLSYLSEILLHYERYYFIQRVIVNYYPIDYRRAHYQQVTNYKYMYPLAYFDLVKRYANEAQIDPFLILAVIREESHFQPKVKSWANAIGLMQILPGTAKYVARRYKKKYQRWQLTVPQVNIMLGTFYLKYLLKRFDSNMYYTLAAYNGGPTNLKRWVRKYGKYKKDRFIEEVTFPETRRYIKKVMKSYEMYQLLYGKI